MAQMNFWEPQGEAWMSAEIHRIAQHYQADHPTLSKLAALYEVAKAGAAHYSIPMDRTPMERRMGAVYLRETNKKQSGTSQGRQRRANSGVKPPKTRED